VLHGSVSAHAAHFVSLESMQQVPVARIVHKHPVADASHELGAICAGQERGRRSAPLRTAWALPARDSGLDFPRTRLEGNVEAHVGDAVALRLRRDRENASAWSTGATSSEPVRPGPSIPGPHKLSLTRITALSEH
jgi:hypothetical protein